LRLNLSYYPGNFLEGLRKPTKNQPGYSASRRRRNSSVLRNQQITAVITNDSLCSLWYSCLERSVIRAEKLAEVWIRVPWTTVGHRRQNGALKSQWRLYFAS